MEEYSIALGGKSVVPYPSREIPLGAKGPGVVTIARTLPGIHRNGEVSYGLINHPWPLPVTDESITATRRETVLFAFRFGKPRSGAEGPGVVTRWRAEIRMLF